MQSFDQVFRQILHYRSIFMYIYQNHLREYHDSKYGQKLGYNAEKKLPTESDYVHNRRKKIIS